MVRQFARLLVLLAVGGVGCGGGGGGSPTAPQSPLATWAWGRWEGRLTVPALDVAIQVAGANDELGLGGGIRSDGMVGGGFTGRLSRGQPPATVTFKMFDAPSASAGRPCSYEVSGTGTMDRETFTGTYAGVLKCDGSEPQTIDGNLSARKRPE